MEGFAGTLIRSRLLEAKAQSPTHLTTTVPTRWHWFVFTVTHGFFLSDVCVCVPSFILRTMSSNVPENLAAMVRTMDSKAWEPVGTHSLSAHPW